MIDVPVEVDIYGVCVECVEAGIPFQVREFIERLIEEDDEMYQESHTKKIEFEVEVFYRRKDGVQVAYDATCHTICPSFVSAWVEREAMRLFKVKEALMTHLVQETESLAKKEVS
jgi:hypothetical protein